MNTLINQPIVEVLDDVVEQEKVKRPSLYKLVVVDDDTSTMSLVCGVFHEFFGKSEDDAWECMMEVHHRGSSIGGIYTKDVAETKIQQISKYCGDYPLRIAKVKE